MPTSGQSICDVLQFLKECDTVAFLKAGRLVEQGTHADLMLLPGGHYRQIAEYDAER
jgi:ABC-type multidrug transport system fused ATPase/permease subunit